ncbi:MAG: hypothetical protein AB7L09_18290 [Nitrospira sp.]|jgi:hypothetical protein
MSGVLNRAAPNRALEEEYEKALGRLTMRFSWLHLFLESFGWLAWKLHPDIRLTVTRDFQTKHLVAKLRETAKFTIPQDADRKCFLSILKRVEKAAERRNDLLHSLWEFHGESVKKTSKKRFDSEIAPTVQDINQFNRSLLTIVKDLAEFTGRESVLR